MNENKFAGIRIERDNANIEDPRVVIKFKMIDHWNNRNDLMTFRVPIPEAISLARFIGSEEQLYSRFNRFGSYNTVAQSIEFQRRKEAVPLLYGAIYLIPAKDSNYLLDLAPTFHPIIKELNKVLDRDRIPLTAAMSEEISQAILNACGDADVAPYRRFFRQ